MKTKNIKAVFTVLAVVATISFSSVVKADEISLPVVSKPSILEEGTQRNLSNAQIAELLPWAKDSKLFLIDLLENIQGLTTTDKIDRLAEGLATVVGESSSKNSELLMRYALNRGLVLNNILANEMSADAVGTADARLRVLKSSIEIALKYYDTDMAILQKKTIAPYVIFGLDYFEFLNELNKSIFDASAQYTIQRTALEWLQWDLYRDLNNASYAAQIVKINNGLKTFPTKKITDAQSIANIRLMKKVGQQLNVKETLAKLEEEKKISLAKTEEDKARLKKEAELERLRGNRSAIDIEKIRIAMNNSVSNSWSVRQVAVRVLNGMIGGDITLALLDRYTVEGDADVRGELVTALRTRLNSTSYLMKIESLEPQRAKVMQLLASAPRVNLWTKRIEMIQLFSYMETMETYKILSAWNEIESDSDVKIALVKAMERVEKNLN